MEPARRIEASLPFRNRRDAGKALAKKLAQYAKIPGPVVLALPRGGVPIAFEVAKFLKTPLDVYVVRKLGAPQNPEFALGAIASGGATVLNHDAIEMLGIPEPVIRSIAREEAQELARRERLYRAGRAPVALRDRTVILIDDGLATGSTMRAAVIAIRQQKPQKIVVAVPIADPGTCQQMQAVADEVVCAETPVPFHAVGLWYEDFSQTSDEEVRALLAEAGASAQEPRT